MMSSEPHCHTCPTRHHCLGSGLEDDALQALGNCLDTCAPLHRGEYLYRAGETTDGCHIVRSGVFKTVTTDASGQEYVTGFHYPGTLLGLSGLHKGTHADSAIALETGTACRLGADRLPSLWQMGGGPSLLRLVSIHEGQQTLARIRLSQSKADCRIARFLLDLSKQMQACGRDGTRLPLPMSRTDLANHLGMTLESLSRIFSRLTACGVLEATRGEVSLRDRAQLEAIASQDPLAASTAHLAARAAPAITASRQPLH